MLLTVNDAQLTVADDISVQQLLEQIGSPKKGVALAVNDSIVPRSEWESFSFSETDNVLVIKAHSGG